MPGNDQPSVNVTWPYLAAQVQESLDPGLIERHGREILARAVTHGRLVAFVGAGMSMAYGRLAWPDLVRKTLEAVEAVDRAALELTPGGAPQAADRRRIETLRLLRQIPPQRAEADEATNPLLILQMCRDVLQAAKASRRGGGKTLYELFSEALESPRAHDERVVAAVALLAADGAFGEGRWDEVSGAATGQVWEGRRHFLEVLRRRDMLSAPEGRDEMVRPHATHSNTQESPIALLLHDLRVRRFATTNYDLEIENALAFARCLPVHAGPTKLGEATDLRCESFSMHENSSARAIGFAVEGRRRHSFVMHLHGRVGEPEHMIVSEADYQRRYLRSSPQRDLMDCAIRTLFGANPILYVGSSIAEDDVLRPLREFMSLAPRRTDRLGVALLPANKPEHLLARNKIESYQRFGIHVIHYGYDSDDALASDGVRFGVRKGDSWLCRFTGAVRTLKDRIGAKTVSADRVDWPAIEPPTWMDGHRYRSGHAAGPGGEDRPPAALDIDQECRLLTMLMRHYGKRQQPLDEPLADALKTMLDEISTSVTTAFVCARLMTETVFRERWAEQLARPIESLRFPGIVWAEDLPCGAEGTDRRRRVYHHMKIALRHERSAYPSRFEDGNGGSGTLDGRWKEFLEGLRRHRLFTRFRGRRLMLLPVPRGAGKGSMFDQLTLRGDGTLEAIQTALAPWDPQSPWRTGLISFNFLSDVANIADVLAGVIRSGGPGPTPVPAPHQVDHAAGRLEQALVACRKQRGGDGDGRVLLVLANVGVLFDRGGEAKNGQVLRLLRLLMSRRFAGAPIDFLVFCDEVHVPRLFRAPGGPDPAGASATGLAFLDDEADPRERFERLNRLKMRGIMLPDLRLSTVHIHAPGRSPAREVARPFIPGVVIDGSLEAALTKLHRAVGGSRIALTLLFALCHEDCAVTGATQGRAEGVHRFIDDATVAMVSQVHDDSPETAIQYVFDRWALLHLRRPALLDSTAVRPFLARFTAARGSDAAPGWVLTRQDPARRVWELGTEILWHLSVLSHPVELAVLNRCPGVVRAAHACLDGVGDEPGSPERATGEFIEAVAELCVYRCLAMRMAARLPAGSAGAQRYTVHRTVQRYFFRTMGGRDIEGIEWDQFTTSLYASQPDDIPALSAEAHRKIKDLIRCLIRYGSPADEGESTAVEEEFQALRAAYFVARSTYSVGVLSHIAASVPVPEPTQSGGHMEDYRRLIRWITHRAQVLQERNDGKGFFHQGEIVWLYAECGVMSLTQGKLEDAESLLQLALQAARRVECDDTGSLHVRLLLHVALTRIERGRPRGAKRMLEQIAQRRDGHEVPPLIAEFYLGLIEHLGGDYHSAYRRYENALAGFRRLDRTRASAFVLKSMADLHIVRHPEQVKESIALAHEAMAVAQRGGHEDVRVLATLSLVRLRTKSADGHVHPDSYRLLDLAERYAQDMGMPRIHCAAHEVRATVLLSQGETKLAAREASTSAEIAALYDLKLFKIKALLTLARIYKLRGEVRQAGDLISTGLEMAYAAEYLSCMRDFRALDSAAAQPAG